MEIQTIITIAAALPVALAFVTWLSAVLIARSRDEVDRCPTCGSDRVRPAWPTIIDNLLSVASVGPFRCEGCFKRFYARKPLGWGDAQYRPCRQRFEAPAVRAGSFIRII